MSQFSDLVADVYTITNRPDLVAETALAVRQATRAAHRSDYYPKDLVETLVVLGSAQSLVQLDMTQFARWRSFRYIRPYDTTSQSAAKFFLENLAADAIFDEYLNEKVNVYYVGGTNCNIKLGAAYSGFLVGYYADPLLVPDAAFNSWVVNDQPALIVIDAAQRLLASIGYDEAAQRLRALVYGPNGSPLNVTGGEYAILKTNALEEQAR